MNFPEEKKEKQEEKKEEIKEEDVIINISEEKKEIEEKENSWDILLEDISSEDIPKDEKQPYFLNLEGLFLKYFTDYCNISYLEDIKENDVYLINKWKLIFFHCIELDEYFLKLDQKNFQNKNKFNKKGQSKEHNSFDYQAKNNLSLNRSVPKKNKSESIKKNDSNSKDINSGQPSNSKSAENNNSSNTEIENEILKQELHSNLSEFKLKEAKQSLQIYENEKIGGKEFEDKCRRILNLMLIFIKRDNYKLLNPKKIAIQNFIKLLKIKEIEKTELTKSDTFEIDVVINNFKVSDLKKLIDNYSSHFFLKEKMKLDDIKEENINFFGEISKNFIIQISNKSEQIKIYFASFKILEMLNEANCPISPEQKKEIFSSFGIEQNKNKNIFFIITDGSYLILKFTFDVISKIDKESKENSKDINEFIDKCIKENEEIIKYLMQYKFNNLKNLIYRTYLTLKYMDNKNFRYCIFFIGDKENNKLENFYKENLKRGKSILETKFTNKIKNLINNLIVLKEKIYLDIKEFKEKTKKFINSLKLDNLIIIDKYYNPNLSDYFKINVNFFYNDKNIIIPNNPDYIIKSQLITAINFENKFIEFLNKKKPEKLTVFIDNQSILEKYYEKNYSNNLLITKETQFNKIFDQIKIYIQIQIDGFQQILNEKIKEKKREINQSLYDLKENLTIELLIEKLKYMNDFCLDLEKIVNFIKPMFHVTFENESSYGEELQNIKKAFEKLLNKEYIINFKSLFSKNLSLLLNNIKSLLLYEYIMNNSFDNVIYSLWNMKYFYSKNKNNN